MSSYFVMVQIDTRAVGCQGGFIIGVSVMIWGSNKTFHRHLVLLTLGIYLYFRYLYEFSQAVKPNHSHQSHETWRDAWRWQLLGIDLKLLVSISPFTFLGPLCDPQASVQKSPIPNRSLCQGQPSRHCRSKLRLLRISADRGHGREPGWEN